MESGYAIAEKLPDLPRWVEVRANLRRGECEIFGLEQEPTSLVIREPDTGTAFVIGQPSPKAIQEAIQRNGCEVIAPFEQAGWLAALLPNWTPSCITLHVLKDFRRLPVAPAGQVDFLDPAELDQFPIPADLLEELRSGAQHSRIAATFLNKQPVSFCYAGAVTESLWDVAIDTLPEYQRQGYAALCAAHLIRCLHQEGKQPVWASLEENPASWQLARKLGFEPVDALVLFEPNRASNGVHYFLNT